MPSTIYRLLLAVLFAAPLAFGSVQPWAWATLGMAAVLLLGWWAVASVRQGVVRIVWPPLYGPPLAMLALGGAQLLGHTTFDPIATREALLKLATALIIFFLAAQLFSPASPLRAHRRVTETQSDPRGSGQWTTSTQKRENYLTTALAPLGERVARVASRVRGSRADTNSAQAWRVLGLTVTVYAAALAVFAIVQFLSSPGLIYWTVKPRWGGWVFGPYVNHNHYAGLMEMLIPLAAVYVLSRPRQYPARLLLAFAVCVAIASVLLSGSRGGLVALAAEVLILTVILLRRAPGRRLAAAGALGIAVAATLFLWMDRGDILKRFSAVASLSRTPEATFGERRLVALDALRLFRQRPFTGTGLGSFETAYPPYRSFASDFEWDHAHNDYAEALAETGLAGLALMLSSLVLFLATAFRNLSDRLRREPGWMQLGAALGCCGLLVHSLVDFNLHIPANAAWFAFCAGLTQSLSSEFY
jgi:O-antigen ligase